MNAIENLNLPLKYFVSNAHIKVTWHAIAISTHRKKHCHFNQDVVFFDLWSLPAFLQQTKHKTIKTTISNKNKCMIDCQCGNGVRGLATLLLTAGPSMDHPVVGTSNSSHVYTIDNDTEINNRPGGMSLSWSVTLIALHDI